MKSLDNTKFCSYYRKTKLLYLMLFILLNDIISRAFHQPRNRSAYTRWIHKRENVSSGMRRRQTPKPPHVSTLEGTSDSGSGTDNQSQSGQISYTYSEIFVTSLPRFMLPFLVTPRNMLLNFLPYDTCCPTRNPSEITIINF